MFKQLALWIAARAQAQNEFIEIHRRVDPLAGEREWCGTGLGPRHRHQFTPADPAQQQGLKGLQESTRQARSFAAHAARNQTDPAMSGRDAFEQQRSFAIGSCVEDQRRFGLNMHGMASNDTQPE